jgi:hypothetical protein
VPTYGGWGGYTQADVTAFARVLTGWRVPLRELLAREDLPSESPTRFEEAWHEPGRKPLLGKVYPEGAQALDQVLHDLSRHPSTARFLACKLARHFVADEPPPVLVERLARNFIWPTMATCRRCTANWSKRPKPGPELAKLKTPDEFVVSTARLLGLGETAFARQPDGGIAALGQRMQAAPSPAGWPDRADEWLGPDAVWKRVEWATRDCRTKRSGPRRPRAGPQQLSARTLSDASRAADRPRRRRPAGAGAAVARPGIPAPLKGPRHDRSSSLAAPGRCRGRMGPDGRAEPRSRSQRQLKRSRLRARRAARRHGWALPPCRPSAMRRLPCSQWTAGQLRRRPALPLDNTVRTQPAAAASCTQMYQSLVRLAVVHAVGLPYRERSHFDAQQVLESGGTEAVRTVDRLARSRAGSQADSSGMAMSTAVPLVMRGSPQVDTWAPSALPEPSADLVARLASMYAGDPALAGRARTRPEPARGTRDEHSGPRAAQARSAGRPSSHWHARLQISFASPPARGSRCSRSGAGIHTRTRPHPRAHCRRTCARSTPRWPPLRTGLNQDPGHDNAWAGTVVVVAQRIRP